MKVLIGILILTISFSCTPSKTTKNFNLFRSEILNERLNTFEKYLPEKFENRLLARIQFAPGYKAFGHSGVNILFELDESEFQKKKIELLDANILDKTNLSDSCFKTFSEETFDYICDREDSLKIPNMFDFYCQEAGLCFALSDFNIVVLELGKGNVYSSKVVSEEYLPEKPQNYVVGAFISKNNNYINYWFFIY